MVATREKWETTAALPRGASYEQMLEFFGIPPSTADALDDNISRKRRRWNHMSNSGNAAGRQKAAEVLKLIQRVSQALKRGMVDDQGGGAETEIPDSVFETLEELWRILTEYVFADEYDEAIKVAREAVGRWHNADAASALAWVVSSLVNSAGFAHPQVLAEALEAAQFAVREQPGEGRNWESAASLLLASSKVDEAVAAIDQAERATGGRATALLYLLRTRAMVTLRRSQEAMTAAVRAVDRAEASVATAVRSEATDLLVSWAATMLPVKSDAELTRYTEMVGVAAWCSYGVPEAEDRVRPYRMWATNAGKRVFTGSPRMRSFLAVLTGFISLPIHNYVRSMPAWQVFYEGQGKEVITDAFFIVAAPAYVQKIHNVSLGLSFQRD
jgi:tetratricopeptide (TPR) repeat protein